MKIILNATFTTGAGAGARAQVRARRRPTKDRLRTTVQHQQTSDFSTLFNDYFFWGHQIYIILNGL